MFHANELLKFFIGEKIWKQSSRFCRYEDLPNLCLQQRALYSSCKSDDDNSLRSRARDTKLRRITGNYLHKERLEMCSNEYLVCRRLQSSQFVQTP